MFIGAVFWMLVMAAMVGDWVVVFAVAAAIAIVPLATLRTLTPWYWRIVLGDMVGAAALTLTVVNLRWNPWMALYRDSRFYERVNDQPLWVMDLMLGALFAFFIGAILFKIRRESTGEQNHE
jgi:hypothetical protein